MLRYIFRRRSIICAGIPYIAQDRTYPGPIFEADFLDSERANTYEYIASNASMEIFMAISQNVFPKTERSFIMWYTR